MADIPVRMMGKRNGRRICWSREDLLVTGGSAGHGRICWSREDLLVTGDVSTSLEFYTR
jgi:hypothetical protein